MKNFREAIETGEHEDLIHPEKENNWKQELKKYLVLFLKKHRIITNL